MLALPALALLGSSSLPLGGGCADAVGAGRVRARVRAATCSGAALGGSAVLTAGRGHVSTAVGFAVALHLSRFARSGARRWSLRDRAAADLFRPDRRLRIHPGLWPRRLRHAAARRGRLRSRPRSRGFLFTPIGLAFASSYYLIPRVVMLLLPVLLNFDRAQLAAAESLGATRRAGVSSTSCCRRSLPTASHRVLPGRRGRVRRLWHGARAGRHAASTSCRCSSTACLGDRLRFSRRGGACAPDHCGLLDGADVGEWIGARHERHL